MISIRTMHATDLDAAMRLKSAAGWNQRTADWQRMMHLEPEGALVAVHGDRVVGTTLACTFGTIGWIAMVLVDAEHRRQGIGTRLVRQAVEYLDRRGIQTQRLDATPLGMPVYQQFGFEPEYELARLTGMPELARSVTFGTAFPEVEGANASQLRAIAALDQQVTGTFRQRLLERLWTEDPQSMRVVHRDEQLVGYATARPGDPARQVGPMVALNQQAGTALLLDALSRYRGEPLLVDVPRANGWAIDCLLQTGMCETRTLVRMRRGAAVVDTPAQIWAGTGPEKG